MSRRLRSRQMAVTKYSRLIPHLSFPLPQFTHTTIMTNQNNPEDCISECIFESAEENIIIENSGMEGSSVSETAPEQENQPESPQEMEPEEGPGLRSRAAAEIHTGEQNRIRC